MQSQYRYVAPAGVRHRVVRQDDMETVVIPARRNGFAVLFLSVWLALWTYGGVMAVAELRRSFELFLAVWLIGWSLGWIMVAASIAWQLLGRETIGVAQGGLLVRLAIGPFRRCRRYRGGEVRHLRVRPQTMMGWTNPGLAPFFKGSGALLFDHGARTIGLASGVDEAEAALLRDWLLARLPK